MIIPDAALFLFALFEATIVLKTSVAEPVVAKKMTSWPARRSDEVATLAEDEMYLIAVTIDFLAALAPGENPFSKSSFCEA